MKESEKILEYIQAQRDKVIEIQKNLVSCPALGPENGGEGEYKKSRYLLEYLKKYPTLIIKKLNAKDNRVPSSIRPNICALLPGKDKSKTLWIVSHMDIVPPGELSLWESDPYTLRIEGDMIYGRGVEDNHQGIVSSILALEAYINTSTTPEFNLGILLVSDEETGNKYGLEFLFNHHRDLFKDEDLFLIPDFGSPESDLIEVAEKGLLWIKIEVKGKQCHASTPNKGKNSLVATSAYIMKLRKLYEIFNATDNMFSPSISTFEPTKKEQNVPNINTIPGKDVFYLDSRILPAYAPKEVFETVKNMAKEIEKEYGVNISLQIVQEISSPPTNPNSPFIEKLKEVISKEYNIAPKLMGVGGGTVAVYPRKEGMCAAVWSTILGTAHQPNEHSSITNTIKDAKVMARLLL